VIGFPPFRLDLRDQRLWRGKQQIEVRPKTYAVLRYLAERPGVLVKTDELLDAVWGEVAVAPVTLSQSIRELRRVLGDDARAPRFIQTVHRRGFRFVARTDDGASRSASRHPRASRERAAEPSLPGRDAELKKLEGLLEDAQSGRRGLVFVTGEPGIGKTRLVAEFFERLALRETDAPLRSVRGVCVEHHGESEPYGPVIDALERLASEDGRLQSVLGSLAPRWLAQLAWRLDDKESKALQSALAIATPTGMLRELCRALEAFTAETTLVLWLEDLHWSDPSTIDLLAALANRPEPARLLVICTYRPVEAAMSEHRVARSKQRLVQQGLATELALEYLDRTAIEDWLRGRLGTLRDPWALAEIVREVTEGNPLFMVTLLDHMLARGWLAQTDGGWELAVEAEAVRTKGPDGLRGVVESRLDEMDPEDRRLLEAASAVEETFAAQAVAAALDVETETVEQVCERLAGWGSLVEVAGRERWPDGSAGQRYHFQHALFRRILYERVPAARMQQIHRRVGQRLEAAFGGQPEPPAAELALHFERGGDTERAIEWLVRNAAQVRRRFADRESVTCLHSALRLLERLPDGEDRARRELEIRFALARAVLLAVSYGAEEQQTNLARARELSIRLVDRPALALVLSWQSRSEFARGNPRSMRAIAEMQRTLAPDVDDPGLSLQIQVQIGLAAGLEGSLAEAERRFDRLSSALADLEPREAVAHLGQDPGTVAAAFAGMVAWLRGYPEQARQRFEAARSRAEQTGDAMGVAIVAVIAGLVEQFRRDLDAVRALNASLAAHIEDSGLGFPYAPRHTTRGWVLVQDGDRERAIAILREGSAAVRAAGTKIYSSILLGTLAEAQLAHGAVRDGLDAIEEAFAFVESSDERVWEAELHRLRGELLARDGAAEPAEKACRKALEVARSQGARSLELRAVTSLARLCRGGPREPETRDLLRGVYEAFTEGFDTADLRDAKELLAAP
jgi:DNA-binding winged helix-turn-helix (wHTH) protein/tetratricopeptide (TPR) repeat protein